ncbi:hypothetical protein ABS767_13085 [Sphingomonas sp. ST-64]|uniref:Glutathione S-transferase n=1 Tax=Sphingomonas plantiphila TaxID=3163295 RepID=A0ABW8YNP2_9SPHN
MGRTVDEHGRIWQRVNEFENYVRDLLDVAIIPPLLRGHANDDPEAKRTYAVRVFAALGWMGQASSDAPYIAGDRITGADIVAAPPHRTAASS